TRAPADLAAPRQSRPSPRVRTGRLVFDPGCPGTRQSPVMVQTPPEPRKPKLAPLPLRTFRLPIRGLRSVAARPRARRYLDAGVAASWLASCAALAGPNPKRGRDRIDPEHAAAVREYVTDPAYLTDWVDHIPVSRKVPDPKAFLGYHIGTPGELTDPE